MAALDTNVILRLLLNDDAAQATAARQLVQRARDDGQTLFVPVTVALELEWVLRSRFRLDKAAVARTFGSLLQTVELQFDAAGALEWALSEYEQGGADFADALHAALALRAHEEPLWTFDRAAATLHGAALLA